MAFGTFSVLDSLAVFRGTVANFGEDQAYANIAEALVAHNAILSEMLNELVERSTDARRMYGGGGDMFMQEMDESGDPNPQKTTTGVTVGFPLRKYAIAMQWTRTALQVMTGAELAAFTNDAMSADAKAVQREIKKAIFTATNTTTIDRFVDRTSLPVKAFVNADSATIPVGPNGETFNAATHTHYLASAAFVAADLTGLIDTVIEHHNQGDAVVYINRAQEAAIRAFTGFVAYLDARVIGANNVNQATGELDATNFNNRAIGIYNGAEIWIKPWVPASYLYATVLGAGAPLVMRTRTADSGDFTLIYENEDHPMRARSWEREFGIAPYRRTAGAALFVAGGAYVTPVFA